MALADGYRSRPATMDDVAAIRELIAAVDIDATGTTDAEMGDIRDDLADPDVDPTFDTLLVLAPGGAAGGFTSVWTEEGPADVWGDDFIHPEHRGRGIEDVALAWLEARALERAAAAGEATAKLTLTLWATEAALGAYLRSAGYRVARHFWRMAIDIEAGLPPPPERTEGITVRGLRAGEERAVHEVLAQAFEDHWGLRTRPYPEWHRDYVEASRFDPGVWLVAEHEGTIVGVSVGSRRGTSGWIRNLGVLPQWRGRGLLTLLRAAFSTFASCGLTRIELAVDAENATGATALYERAGMRIVHEYLMYRKALAHD